MTPDMAELHRDRIRAAQGNVAGVLDRLANASMTAAALWRDPESAPDERRAATGKALGLLDTLAEAVAVMEATARGGGR